MTDPGVQAPIHKNPKTTLPRVSNFYTSSRFKETNLVGRLYPETAPVSLSHWYLKPEDGKDEGAWENWKFEDIIQQEFLPVELGGSYGPTWSTHWFKVEYQIPEGWQKKEVRFRWVSGTEATVWSADGSVLQGLSTGTDSQLRTDFILTHSFSGTSNVQEVLYVEMAASRMFGASMGDQIDPPDPCLYFSVTKAELAVMDIMTYQLMRDLEILYQLADNLLQDDPRGYMAMHTGNQMVNSILEGKDKDARNLAKEYFSKGNGSRVHNLAVIGNCHIDSAWLWPFSETKRKVARSYSSQLKLIDDYPELIFVASQAQQWSWCKEYYPELFERIKSKIATGNFLPVGSTWTEMDGNIPSGESFIRQFFYGQKFFKNECNYTCKEFWLPDTFGYNGQIPGLMKHVGLARFLTQKLSWNMVNKFPNHNFLWEGIDGSTVLSHFPPGDSYSMNVTVSEAIRTEKNLLDKGRVSTSAFLFGYGDGGGGPTQDMLERRRRLADADGCPKMIMMSPNEMFERLENEEHNMMRWVGELFLELHNGTYTTQASMKQLCRYAEFRLRDAEFLLASAVGKKGVTATKNFLNDSLSKLETSWKKVLLNQFHDVLPGSGIEIIYPEAEQYYNEAIEEADNVYDSSVKLLFGTNYNSSTVVMNTLQWPRKEIIEVGSRQTMRNIQKQRQDKFSQKTKCGQYILVNAPPFGYARICSVNPDKDVKIEQVNGIFKMSNGEITAEISKNGQVISLQVVGNERDLFTCGENTGNQITLYDDEPLYWDAWDVMDYHLETAKILNTESSKNVTTVTIDENGPLVGRLKWGLKISAKSSMTQEIELRASCPYLIFNTTVEWHESHKMLKTNFSTNLLVRKASYEIQFGFIERATHMNTSWDTARYEVCGHKWADISEPNFGMTVLNDSKFGWEGRGSVLTLSLLKAPKAPDDTCDMRTHSFKYAVMPHEGTLQAAEVMRRGYEFNNPLRTMEIPNSTLNTDPSWSVINLEGEGVVLHTFKATDDGSGDLLLRVFESHGCRSSAKITLQFICSSVKESNGLEILGDDVEFTVSKSEQSTTINVSITPFCIYALRLSVADT